MQSSTSGNFEQKTSSVSMKKLNREEQLRIWQEAKYFSLIFLHPDYFAKKKSLQKHNIFQIPSYISGFVEGL